MLCFLNISKLFIIILLESIKTGTDEQKWN